MYNNLKADGVLDECLVESFDMGLISEGPVFAFTSSINQASNPTEYEAIKRCVAPFQAIAVPQQVAGGGGISADNMAKIIKTSSDQSEKKRLKSGHVKCLEFYLGGDVDFEAGTVTSLAIPTLTQAFQDALQEPQTLYVSTFQAFLLRSIRTCLD